MPGELSPARQALRNELRELERRALKGQRKRTQAISAANERRNAGLAELTPTTVGGWFESGIPAKDFLSLWALVQVLLEWSEEPQPRMSGASAAGRREAFKAQWKVLWEQARNAPSGALRRRSEGGVDHDGGELHEHRPDVGRERNSDHERSRGLGVRREQATVASAQQVRAYLTAARQAAARHPYPAIRGEASSLPLLADVYVHQHARTQPQEAPDCPALDDATPTGSLPDLTSPADEVFRTDSPICLLLAGPGGGKSTLLRAHLAESAASWLNGGTGKTTPVIVSARELAGVDPLPLALAKAATSALRQFGLLDELTAEFFRHQSGTGVPWLVLVDGLDEIPDADTRGEVLRILASVTPEEPTLYRFVVATRPLPAGEIEALGPKTPRYELLPFSFDDLVSYAERCFRGLDDPRRHAGEFAAALRRSRLDVLACTPLMASMLCQLYKADPARPLPHGRAGAYEAFVELVYEQNAGRNIRSAHDEAIRRLKDPFQVPKHHEAAERAAREAVDHLPELIDYLAYSRVNGSAAPAAEILCAHLHVNRPQKVKEQTWQAFLNGLLRSTGLVSQHGEDLVFLHQTLLEYHAARHATRDDQACTELLRDLVTAPDLAIAPNAFPHPGRTPGMEPSYLGFLLDGLLASGDQIAERTTHYLDDLTASATSGACRFLTAQLELGTNLPLGLTAARLVAFADDACMPSYHCVAAAVALTRLEGHRDEAAGLLADLAQDYNINGEDRVWAAEVLAGLEGYREEAVDLLAHLIHHPDLVGHQYDVNVTEDDKRLALQVLAGCDRHRATSVLIDMADTARSDHHRAWVASLKDTLGQNPPDGQGHSSPAAQG